MEHSLLQILQQRVDHRQPLIQGLRLAWQGEHLTGDAAWCFLRLYDVYTSNCLRPVPRSAVQIDNTILIELISLGWVEESVEGLLPVMDKLRSYIDGVL